MATLNSKSEWGGGQNSPTVSDKNWKRDKWCDPLQLTPNVELQINALYFETPSPYAILPTPESVLGLENSMTQNIPLSIGTTTSWSPTITPTQLVNSVKRSRKTKSSTKKQSTLSSRSRHSRTPFDRMQSQSQAMSPMHVQALCPSLPQGIAPLDQDSGNEAKQEKGK